MSDTVSVHIPITLRQRGGRKEILLPREMPPSRTPDNTLVKAIARAFRWKRMLESGEFVTVKELAEHEGIAFSYMTRVLRMTLLAPDIVEAVLDGRALPGLNLGRALESFPMEWEEQHHVLSQPNTTSPHGPLG